MKTTFASTLGFLGIGLVLLSACGSDVDVAGQGGSSASGTSSSTGSGGCAGSAPMCAWGCGSDAFDQGVCQEGTWTCPPGTIDPADCPAGTCWGPPVPCEICDNGWKCAPNAACIGSCNSFVCATCDGTNPGITPIGPACQCSCNGSNYGCELIPGCCMQDSDCGDKQLFPCVNNVCKAPVMGGCWADIECGPGMKCEGAVVCPCNYDCDAPDSPGMCVPM